MSAIWANRLMAGTKTWAEVPTFRKNAVKDILRSRVESNTITAERYQEITGEVYEA